MAPPGRADPARAPDPCRAPARNATRCVVMGHGIPRIRNAATSAPPSYASTRNPPLNPLQQPGLRVLAVAPAFHPVLEPVLAGCPTQPVLAGCGTAAAQPVLAGCGTSAAAKSLFVNPPAASEQQRLRIRFCKTPGGSGTAEILVLRRRRRQPRDGIALAKPYFGGFQVGGCVCVCVCVCGGTWRLTSCDAREAAQAGRGARG